MKLSEVVHRFKSPMQAGQGWKCICPCHADYKASLAITHGEEGRIVLHCHAGCDTDKILASVGLTMSDLFDSGVSVPRQVVKELSEEQANLRHQVYIRLLLDNPLWDDDFKLMQNRGITNRFAYGTLTLDGAKRTIKREVADYGREELVKVPGFVQDATGCIKLVKTEGILIPVRDVKGRIVAIQLRVEDEDGKYKWLSSAENSCGSVCHVPLQVSTQDLGFQLLTPLRITEGPLKADVCMALQPSRRTIGIPGVNTWETCLPILKRIAAPDTPLYLAFDSDWKEKPQVKLCLHQLYQALEGAGYKNILIENWEGAKGIDDALLKGCFISTYGEESVTPTLEEEYPEHANIICQTAAEIQETEVKWLWKDWLPLWSLLHIGWRPW